MTDDCIFCMVASKQIDARVVYEDDLVLAFDDITPQAPVHTLIIPKRHYADMGDGVPAEVIAALFTAVPTVAGIKGVIDSGYRVIVNSGPDASQTVGHLHVHVLGGAHMTHGMVSF
ncbi:MAG: HIT domain-containing protein [Coriobacteriia bacterium]|nr:HIT domain-containing protein [Coriobacteriia bacterium]